MTTKTSYFMRPLALVMCTALAASVMMVVLASPAQAANITVNSLADDADGTDGECTLREAITNANTDTQPPGVVAGECAAGSGSDVIDVGVTGTVQLTGKLPDLSSNLEIKGPGADQFTVRRDTGGDYRIFLVSNDTLVSISGITISNGKISGPGAGVINFGNLTITSSTISGNEAVRGSGSNANRGGGIYNASSNLTITSSTISGNSAVLGGGVYSDTNLSFLQKTTITNSTISGNSAIRGGGVMNFEGLTVIEHSTITNNNTDPFDEGGGVASQGDTLTRTEVLSTIISANTASTSTAANTDVFVFSGTTNSFDSKGYNLIGDGNATAAFNKTGDQVGVTDPGLDPLGSYGGSTQTHRLQSDSPALDAGPPSTSCPPPATDQRGVTRPQDGNNDATARCDIGSFELDTLSPRVSGTNPKKGATGVLPTANVKANFPEIMLASSINGQTFKLFEEGTNIKVAAAVRYLPDALPNDLCSGTCPHRANLNPTDPLKSGVTYRAVVTTGAADLSGNPLDQKPDKEGNQKKSWTFTVS